MPLSGHDQSDFYTNRVVQTGRAGLCSQEHHRFLSKEPARGRRCLVTEEIRRCEEQKRLAVAVSQSQQGQWTSWDT